MIQKYIDREFVKTDGITSFKSEIEYSVHKNDQKIKENAEQIQKAVESIEKKIKSEVKSSVAKIKGSYLQDESKAEAMAGDGQFSSEYIELMLKQKVDK